MRLCASATQGWLARALVALALAVSVAGCGPVELGIERTATPSAQAAAALPEAPVATATGTPTPLPSPTPPATDRVQIFLIAMEDDGKNGKAVGCGDSVVAVEIPVPPTHEPLRAALEALLSNHDRYYGESGLYNALYQTDLRVDSAVIEDGRAIVHISGAYTLGGICDEPRAKAQLEETAGQFADEVVLYIN